jgi:ATP-dependent Clp protease adaptor protein ClpS
MRVPLPSEYLSSIGLDRRLERCQPAATKSSEPVNRMPGTIELPTPDVDVETDPKKVRERIFTVIVWDDPVNLMPYVTHVFQQVFGWGREKAQRHMLEVHEQGRSVVVRDSFEKAEYYVHALQKYSLTATLEPAS